MSTTRDYFPSSDPQREQWFKDYKTGITANGTAVGVEGATLTEQQAACTECINAFEDLRAKKGAYDGAVATKNVAVSNAMDNVLRPGIKRLKTAPGFTPAIGAALHVVGEEGDHGPESAFSPKITASNEGGFIRIKFVKGMAEGVNIYHRLKGSGNWQFLARDTKSPYDDHVEIAAGGAPQHWEYQAYGVKDDAQFGQPSLIAEATIG